MMPDKIKVQYNLYRDYKDEDLSEMRNKGVNDMLLFWYYLKIKA